MSIATALTFLSKVFGKFSATLALFFVALAGSYYMGIINELVFMIFFIGLLIMLFIDVGISFFLSQRKKIKIAGKEDQYIDENYLAYRESLKRKKASTITGDLTDIAIGIGGKVVDAIKPRKETDDERIARLKAELREIE